MNPDLIKKYNKQVPRYTSYPTVPHWMESNPSQKKWISSIDSIFNVQPVNVGIAIYIHLPYCESLCHYCACNKAISKNHEVELPYIRAVVQEWKLYKKVFDRAPKISEIHFGGGTPTFFSPENLKLLIENIIDGCEIESNHDFSFEGHPNNTTYQHLQTLYDLGFNRVSFGIQDFDPLVQKSINRIQPLEIVRNVTQWARDIGYESINFDLIYGLPNQTLKSVENTFSKVLELKPDRIAFYSYAHVPWKTGIQRKFNVDDLPSGVDKRALYELGKSLLEDSEYVEIGMDHFSLKSDSLFVAKTNYNLHRNFMGYNTNNCQILIGLGSSSITDIGSAYMQNEKGIGSYIRQVNDERFAIVKGHYLNSLEMRAKEHIMNLMCQGMTYLTKQDRLTYLEGNKYFNQLLDDNLISVTSTYFKINEFALPLMRNVCKVFDAYSIEEGSLESNRFSLAV